MMRKSKGGNDLIYATKAMRQKGSKLILTIKNSTLGPSK